MSKERIEEISKRIEELKAEKASLIDALRKFCKHDVENIVRIPFEETTFGYYLPKYVCTACRLTERAWSTASSDNFKHIDEYKNKLPIVKYPPVW